MPELVPAFLSSAERSELLRLSDTPLPWTLGRQGTGYEIASLRDAPPPAVSRALALLGATGDRWDAYFLRYRDGAFVPPHLDPAQPGLRHRRLNALLSQAAAGGELHISGAAISLAPGDAVIFYPDSELHEVAPVAGTRLLLSVGALV